MVPYLRAQPRHKDGARLGSTPVAAQKRGDPRWTPTWRPRPKLCPLPPEPGGRPGRCRIETTLTVEEPPADPENPCSPSIPAGAASYPPASYAEHPGPIDVRTLLVTPFETLGPAEPGLEPVHTMIQEFIR